MCKCARPLNESTTPHTNPKHARTSNCFVAGPRVAPRTPFCRGSTPCEQRLRLWCPSRRGKRKTLIQLCRRRRCGGPSHAFQKLRNEMKFIYVILCIYIYIYIVMLLYYSGSPQKGIALRFFFSEIFGILRNLFIRLLKTSVIILLVYNNIDLRGCTQDGFFRSRQST